MMKNLTFVTGNPNKVIWFERYAGFQVAHQKLDLPEIQSLSLSEIVEAKAHEAYQRLKKPVLIEDTSLIFHALGKLPGPLIKWFLTELGNDGMCFLLNGYRDRSAVAEVQFAIHDGKRCTVFSGKMLGKIAATPRGTNGYGWDPIFIPKGRRKTWGEMTATEQEATSIRRIALSKVRKFLQKQTS